MKGINELGSPCLLQIAVCFLFACLENVPYVFGLLPDSPEILKIDESSKSTGVWWWSLHLLSLLEPKQISLIWYITLLSSSFRWLFQLEHLTTFMYLFCFWPNNSGLKMLLWIFDIQATDVTGHCEAYHTLSRILQVWIRFLAHLNYHLQKLLLCRLSSFCFFFSGAGTRMVLFFSLCGADWPITWPEISWWCCNS